MSALRRDIYVEDVEFLKGVGTSPEAIAARLGLKPQSLGRALLRAGRPDLARPFFAFGAKSRPSRAKVRDAA